ncbi:MAG: hypothetical protein CM15mV31_0420 [uncultured marine virus]|nr:MAG: hypothetical protein CM15mV31_0420 [uncultured marine virus]
MSQTIIIPEGEKPKAFQTVIPQKSYKDLAESMGRTETEYNRLLDTRYDMTGTGAQLGARQRGIEMQEAASYASSLPKALVLIQVLEEFPIKSNATFDTVQGECTFGNKSRDNLRKQIGGTGAPPQTKSLAKQAAEKRYDDAKDYYLAALEKAKKTPRSFMKPTKDPGFAQNPSIYLPQIINAPDEEINKLKITKINTSIQLTCTFSVIKPKLICSSIFSFTNLQSKTDTFNPIE